MWFDEDINLTIETGPVINVSGAVQFSNIDSVTVHEFEQPIIIQTSEYFAPVQSVNGKVGFVNIDKTDVGLSNVENISIINVSGYLQNEIDNISGDFYLNSNPSGYITGVDLSAYVTKSSGAFTNRPTVNGTGVLLSGEVAGLPTTILYTTGNQIKSGRLIIGNDAISIVDPNSQYTLSLQTNSPATWLEILNNSGANKGVFFGIQDNDFEQYNWQGGDITFFTAENVEAGYARLKIKNDGKVGIGINSPSEKLDVAGNVKASGASFNNRPTVNGSGVLLSGEAYPSNNPSGFITGVNLSNYATNSNLSLTGANLDNKINSLSGYVEEENILVFTAELPSGEETAFLTYPFSISSSPSSITCSFQNTIDNVIYTYTLGQITQSGFYANFSDILSNSGYLLKVKVKK